MAERYFLLPVGTGNPYPENTARHAAYEAGRASLAASAGSEPVTGMNEYGVRGYLAATLKCWHRLTGDEAAELVAMTQRLSGLYQPYPPEGMVGGWMPIETAPKDGTEILLYAPACDCEGTHVQARTTYGRWCAPSDTPRIKYQDGFAPEPEWEDFEPFWASWDGGFTEEHPPTHWRPLPPPPTTPAGSGKGESNADQA